MWLYRKLGYCPLMQAFYKLTGGRPMVKVTGHTVIFDGSPIGYWRDKFGRIWLADLIALTGGWQSFRVATPWKSTTHCRTR